MTAPRAVYTLCVVPVHQTHTRTLHLFVAQSGDGVDVLLLDHEGRQVGRVGGEEDDGEEGPDQHHDLAGGALRVLDGHRVVEDDAPQQPH